jgi:hypothetical protein
MFLFALLLSATEVVARCDGGDELARVLRALGDERSGPIVVHVTGVCRGPIEITRDRLILSGDDPETARIEGEPGVPGAPLPIVSVRGARGVRLLSLRISNGAVGVRAIASELTLEGCDLARTDVAVDAEGSTLALERTTLREARVGLAARRSRVASSFGTIRDVSDEGLLVSEASQCTLFRADVRSGGLSIGGHSTLVATHCMLDGPVYADEYSQISLAGASGPTALLRGDIRASNSGVFLFRLPVEGAVRVRGSGLLEVHEAELGETHIDGGSHAQIASSRIAADVLAEGFSTVRLTSTTVEGALVCRSGADAVCEGSGTASISGCRSCVVAAAVVKR